MVTVNEFGTPYTKTALFALVNEGACCRMIVKACVTAEPIPLFAVKLMLKSPPTNTSRSPFQRARAVPVVDELEAGWQMARLRDAGQSGSPSSSL